MWSSNCEEKSESATEEGSEDDPDTVRQKTVAEDERRRQEIVAEVDASDFHTAESEDAAPASAGAGPTVSPDAEEESDESGFATPTRRPRLWSDHAETVVKERRRVIVDVFGDFDAEADKRFGRDDDARGVSSACMSSGSSVSYF